MLELCYTALSPFCRKVRMAMEFKELEFDLLPGDDLTQTAFWNPRAEVPILRDADTVICNSPDILGYLDRRYPERPVYPMEASRYAETRSWERFADTLVDPIVTVIGNFRFADLPPLPDELLLAARRDMKIVYDLLQDRLLDQNYICGKIGAADFALYPHIASGAALGLPCDPAQHSSVLAWVRRLRDRPEGRSDLLAAREWWQNQHAQEVDTQRVNWGAYRLEWLLANGFTEWFLEQVREDRVLWSTGPNNNALNHRSRQDRTVN